MNDQNLAVRESIFLRKPIYTVIRVFLKYVFSKRGVTGNINVSPFTDVFVLVFVYYTR